jgi:hypothetical protein
VSYPESDNENDSAKTDRAPSPRSDLQPEPERCIGRHHRKGQNTAAPNAAVDEFERLKRKKKPAILTQGSTVPLVAVARAKYDVQDDAVAHIAEEAGAISSASVQAGEITASRPACAASAVGEEEVALTSRTPEELHDMEFDPADDYLENGMLSKGQPLTILGPGGVGKSHLLLQLAICSMIGREFLGWKVTKRRLRWLIIQAENSNRRLRGDLRAMRPWIGEEFWPLVNQRLIIHTLEKDHDSFLSLGNQRSAELLAQLINREKADVVAFDPLNAFAVGNLNTDAAMFKTCRVMADLARRGNSDCALVVLHHTLTGTAGLKKAVGYDRASYGRGSKALNLWTRGQINVAPVEADNNERLVISCGKSSNGPEFAPFGVKLNPTALVYEKDPEFDLAVWSAKLRGETHSATKPTPEAVAALVKDLPLARKALKELVMEELGCGQAAAYALIAKSEGKTIRRNTKKEYEAITE